MEHSIRSGRAPAWKAALGLLVMLAVTMSLCSAAAPPAGSPQAVADAQGAVSVLVDGLPYMLTAAPGTFPPGQHIEVGRADAPLDAGAGRLVAPPVQVTSTVQPAHAVTIATTEPYDVDPALTVAALWDPGSNDVRILPVARLPNGRLQVEVPHFSALALVTFGSPEDLQKWWETVIGGVIDSIGDFFDAPYECPPALFASSLVDSTGYPSSINLQVDVADDDVANRISKVTICNKLRFVMAYHSTGAGSMTGLALPRSKVALVTPLHGNAGDPFVINTELTPDAVTATLLFVAFEALEAHGVVEKILQKGLFSATGVTFIANSTLACASAVMAARASPGADSWKTALDCLKDTDDFYRALVQVATDEIGEKAATALFGATSTRIILGGHAVDRLLAEWLTLHPESSVTFPYKLRCGDRGSCAVRPPAQAADPASSSPPEPQIRPTPPRPTASAQPVTPSTAPAPDRQGESLNPTTTSAASSPPQPSSSAPTALADLRIVDVEVRNASRSGGRYLCGDEVNLVMGIDNPNAQAVDSTVEAVVYQSNGQTAYGDGRDVSLPAGRTTQSWSFTLPTDWFAYPYTYEFVAYLKPGGYFNSGPLHPSQSSTHFTMECTS